MASEKKSVAFVCVGNSCRSQMAEGFGRHLLGPAWEVYSAGSRPSRLIDPLAIEVMAELGIDISSQSSKSIADLPIKKFDLVVTMGCGDACPTLQAVKRLDWQIPDPIGQSQDFFREVRNELERKIRALVEEKPILASW